ncbi:MULTISPECIES: lyase family protein [unclassified Meiothermus]|uniref:lyase family protein n=1 Tax=unclassified Meiothermus TaxID=370471 RepID=UPI000D7C8EED|nr:MULTISPECIES: lyase family protein [unclassified Meiothermus]PZA06536.1 argininosuccinate lyase [Meiothermus sp. Pnk-1]RYM37212.1 argininosuccinate lyase [Meiothermus sp. PNK-Is4]
MSRWHAVYRRWVLGRHYRFAREHLVPYFFDALTAYSLGLAAIGVPRAAEAAKALAELRKHPLPSFNGLVEDVFFAIDQQLTEHWGLEVAGTLRRGLSRNDLDLTVFRAFARDRALLVLGDLLALRRRMLLLADEHRETLMVAYTHHRPAQPTTLGHYLLGLENLLSRDTRRLWAAIQTTNASPLGASSLAGSPYRVDREAMARLLGFGKVVENTYDAVAAGDWALELAQALAALGASLSRMARDLLFWAEREAFVVGERVAQGSSIMPQKHNPVILEHVRALVAELLGGPQILLALNHNTAYGDLNDHSTGVLEPLERLFHLAQGALELSRVALEESRFVPERIAEGLADRSVVASELVDVLVAEGYLPLGEAYARVKRMLAGLAGEGRTLDQLGEADLAAYLGFGDPDLLAALEPRRFVERRRVQGGAAPGAQIAHQRQARGRLTQDRRTYNALRLAIRQARRLLSEPEAVLTAGKMAL